MKEGLSFKKLQYNHYYHHNSNTESLMDEFRWNTMTNFDVVRNV